RPFGPSPVPSWGLFYQAEANGAEGSYSSSPSSSPWLDVGAPPSIDGTPAGGAGFGAAVAGFRPPPPPRFAADRPELFFAARLWAAFRAGFLAALRLPPFFLAVLPAAFLVVFVVFFAAFFLFAAIPVLLVRSYATYMVTYVTCQSISDA